MLIPVSITGPGVATDTARECTLTTMPLRIFKLFGLNLALAREKASQVCSFGNNTSPVLGESKR